MYRIGTVSAAVLIVLFAILNVTVFPFISIYDIKPDILIIAVLFFSLYGGFTVGATLGLFAGLIKEIFTGGVFGTEVLFLSSLGIFFGYNFSKFYREKAITQLILTFSSCLCYSLFCYFFLKFIRNIKGISFIDMSIWRFLWSMALPFSLYTAVFAPPIFFMLHKVFRTKY